MDSEAINFFFILVLLLSENPGRFGSRANALTTGDITNASRDLDQEYSMFDAVDAAVERRRTAIADRRFERCVGAKTDDKRFGLYRQNRRRMLHRKRTLLDRSGKEAHRHRAAVDTTTVRRKKRPFRIAIVREFLERAMVGRLFWLVHRLAISNTSRSRTVQTHENRHEQRKEPGFKRMPDHQLNYRLKTKAGYVTPVTFAKSIAQLTKR